jgi:hypothetical protein
MRWIDEVIAFVKAHPHMSDVHKQVLAARLEPEPTEPELNLARLVLAPQTCIVKFIDLGTMRVCGRRCEFLTEEQAHAEGLMYSGWYHHGTPRPALGHQAVPRSYI